MPTAEKTVWLLTSLWLVLPAVRRHSPPAWSPTRGRESRSGPSRPSCGEPDRREQYRLEPRRQPTSRSSSQRATSSSRSREVSVLEHASEVVSTRDSRKNRHTELLLDRLELRAVRVRRGRGSGLDVRAERHEWNRLVAASL